MKPLHTENGECTSNCRRVGCPDDFLSEQENDDAWFRNWQDDEFLARSMFDLEKELTTTKTYLSEAFLAKAIVKVYGFERSERIIAKIANECRLLMKQWQKK